MIVADTDVLIDYLTGRSPAADRVTQELAHGRLHTTAISRYELLAGARDSREEKIMQALLASLPCLPLDSVAADRAVVVRRFLDKTGQPIGMADSLIAGMVLAHNAVLLTRNRRHFLGVPGLLLADAEE